MMMMKLPMTMRPVKQTIMSPRTTAARLQGLTEVSDSEGILMASRGVVATNKV